MTGQLILSSYTYDVGRNAINEAFSGCAYFNGVSGTSITATSLTIESIGAGTAVYNLGVDTNGRIVTATTTSSIGFQTLTDAATITWGYNLGANAEVTLTDIRTLVITGATDGCSGILLAKQDAVGSRNIIFGGAETHKVINGGLGAIVLSKDPNAEDILSFVFRASTNTFYWNLGYNYN